MMTLYVYDPDTRHVIAKIHGADNAACQRVVSDQYGDTDRFAATYSPALGANDGLIDDDDAEVIHA